MVMRVIVEVSICVGLDKTPLLYTDISHGLNLPITQYTASATPTERCTIMNIIKCGSYFFEHALSVATIQGVVTV